MPQVATGPEPVPGQGRLIVDVVDGPAAVQRVQMEARPEVNLHGRTTYRFRSVPQVLCTAPCVADLPVGNILLGFPVIGNKALEVELVYVGPDPSVYRRSLGLYEDKTGGVRTLGIVSTSVGAAAVITGLVLLSVGLSNDDQDGNTAVAAAGGITLGTGAALLALGIWAIRHDAPTLRPGSANHFPLSPRPQ